MEITPYMKMFKDNFTGVKAISPDGKLLIMVINQDLKVDTEAIYANVQGIYSGGGAEDRGKVYHTLKFVSKTPVNDEPGNGRYLYTFQVTNPDPENPIPKNIFFKVTIQPFNTSLAKISYLDSDLKRITFNVTRNGPYKLQKKYVIKSYCLDDPLECNATCVDIGNNKTEGPTVTFKLSDVDFHEISLRIHCQFSFVEKSLFGDEVWLNFKKSKSLKKRTKTVVKKMSKRSASPKRSKSPKRIVKNVKKQTKRSRPVKNE
jgi:hypothetical protein